jgi:hypothetical protein
MKKFITTLTVLMVLTITSARVNAQAYQPFPTDDATWEVVRCHYFFQPGWYDHYEITMDGSDTLYDGNTYKQLHIVQHLAHGAFDSIYAKEFFGGIREVNQQVYLFQTWGTIDTTDHLIYDFTSTNVGDTIYTSAMHGPPSNLFGHVVMSTDSVLVGSQYHKRLFLQDPNSAWNTEYWIEGVGSSWGLPFASFWSITDNSYDLTCFYETQQLMYTNPSPTFGFCNSIPTFTCDPIVTEIATSSLAEILVDLYPNPAGNMVTLDLNTEESSDLTVTIYSAMGTIVKTQTLLQNHTQLNIEDLTNGIYVVVVQSNDFIGSNRLVIQR